MHRNHFLLVGSVTAALAACAGVAYIYKRKRELAAIRRKVDRLMNILDQPNVYISSSAVLRRLLKKLVMDGSDKLQVLSDFDKTISKYWIDGKRGESCHGVIEKASCMPLEFREKVAAIKARYYPLEMSPNLTRQQKVPLMVEWWTSVHSAMVDAGIKRHWLTDMVSEALIRVRDGTKEFLELLLENKIPLVVFSAGVGDIIDEVLESEECPLDGLKVISNYMDFDDQGILVGFSTELIHSYNKHDISCHWSDYFDKTRPNDILLGDTVGDTSMADGLDKGGTTLKIAFLNDQVEKLLDHFLEAFDIVICEDQTFYLLLVFFEELLKPYKP